MRRSWRKTLTRPRTFTPCAPRRPRGSKRKLQESGRPGGDDKSLPGRVQHELEALAPREAAAITLCDRGTLDGLAYWPGTPEEFFAESGTTLAAELARYDAVIHLRTPSLADGYNHRNVLRTETPLDAAAIDERIAAAWKEHPHRIFVESRSSFLDKAAEAVRALRAELPSCCRGHVIDELGLR